MSKPLQIIYNLDGLSDEAIKQYMRDVSVYFDLDPEVNWFDVLWMTDPDTGLRRRQLYARRGTTDILRDKRGISVTDMVHHDGPGFVSFTAKGVNKAGRQEMAVGAHSTEGLKGEKLAAAVATAETRAGRRLTLKFCGLGILDYTEVTDPVEIRATPADIEPVAPAPIFAPTVSFPTPSAAPGKQVDRAAQDSLAQAKAEADEISRKALEQLQSKDVITMPPGLPPGEYKGTIVQQGDSLVFQVEPGQSTAVDNASIASEALVAPKTRRTRKKPNTVDISTPRQVSVVAEKVEPIEAFDAQGHGIGLVVPVSVNDEILARAEKAKPFSPEQAAIIAIDPLVRQAARNLKWESSVEEPTRPRKSPSADIPQSQPSPTREQNYTADGITAVPVQVNPAVPTQVNPAPQPPPIQTSPIKEVAQASAVPWQPILAPPQPAPVTDFPGKPTKEQEATYREELRAYSNIILPTAGMTPSANIGGPSNKLRLYAERMSGKPTQQMTVDDWEDFFTQMKEFRATNGDKKLVAYINDVIGAR